MTLGSGFAYVKMRFLTKHLCHNHFVRTDVVKLVLYAPIYTCLLRLLESFVVSAATTGQSSHHAVQRQPACNRRVVHTCEEQAYFTCMLHYYTITWALQAHVVHVEEVPRSAPNGCTRSDLGGPASEATMLLKRQIQGLFAVTGASIMQASG